MGIIEGAQFLDIADRLARQAINLEDAVLTNTSGIGYYVLVHGPLPFAGDFEVENDLIVAANQTDVDMVFNEAATTFFTNMINALNNHVVARGQAASIASMDDYLNQSGINVHELYNESHNAVVGSDLNAVNVFRDDEILMATVETTASGVGTFTDGEALGTGTGSFVRDTGPGQTTTPNSAEQSIKYIVEADIGAPNDLVINVVGTNEQGNTVAEQVTIPSGTLSGVGATIGPSQRKYLDVTAVQFAGGNAGSKVQIRSIVERDPMFLFV